MQPSQLPLHGESTGEHYYHLRTSFAYPLPWPESGSRRDLSLSLVSACLCSERFQTGLSVGEPGVSTIARMVGGWMAASAAGKNRRECVGVSQRVVHAAKPETRQRSGRALGACMHGTHEHFDPCPASKAVRVSK